MPTVKRLLDDQVAAHAVDQGRAHRAEQPDDDEEDCAQHGPAGCPCRAPAPARSSKRSTSVAAAPEQLDQQRAADVERLVHHGVHLGVGFHLLRGRYRAGASPSRRAARMKSGRISTLIRVSRHSSVSITSQHRRRLDDVGDDADDGVADGVLRADHVVVQAAHQLADLGVGEEAQRHALQVGVQRHAQVVDHAFAHPGVQPPLDTR